MEATKVCSIGQITHACLKWADNTGETCRSKFIFMKFNILVVNPKDRVTQIAVYQNYKLYTSTTVSYGR